MSACTSATLLRGWRFSYDDLVETFGITENNEEEILDKLYNTEHFYCDNGYADVDCKTYYLGIMLAEVDMWDNSIPINLAGLLASSAEDNENLIKLWNSLEIIFPAREIKTWLFPRIT